MIETRAMPWCRLWTDKFLRDKKLKRVARHTGESLATVRGVFIGLICIANDDPEREGRLYAGSDADDKPMAAEWGEILEDIALEEERARAIVEEMDRIGIIQIAEPPDPWVLVNFKKWNPPSDATGAYRAKKSREKKKEEDRAGDSPQANPTKDKRRGSDDKPDPSLHSNPVEVIKQHFLDITGQLAPPTDPGQDRRLWENPIREWLGLANDDADLVCDWIDDAVAYSRAHNLAWHRPSSIDTVLKKSVDAAELKRLWATTRDLISLNGYLHEPEDLDPLLKKIIDEAGGWVQLCKMHSEVSREKFALAYGRVMSHGKRKNKADRL